MTSRILLVALALVLAHPTAMAAQEAVGTVVGLGDAFPHLGAQSLAGHSIEVPMAGAAKPSVIIFSFSREAGDESQRWAERLSADSMHDESDLIIVAELQSVPRILRGTVGYAIKRGITPALREHMIILDQDEDVWKHRLSVTSTARAYVTLIDASGRVRWMSAGPYGDAAVAQLRAAIGALRARIPSNPAGVSAAGLRTAGAQG